MGLRVELRREAGRATSLGRVVWVRRRDVARVQGPRDECALAQVVDHRGDTLGWGLLGPDAAILVRMVSWDEPPEEDWVERRLCAAIEARRAYRFEEHGSTAHREVNSEGDGLPGLVLDRYGDDRVLSLGTAAMWARRDAIVACLTGSTRGRLLVHVSETAARLEGFRPPAAAAVQGPAERPLRFREHGLVLEAPAAGPQKTGAFLDQRDNHQIVAGLAAAHGGPLCELGCHVGGFALHARAAGLETLGVDQSERALSYARRNEAENGLSGAVWVAGDMFGPLDDPRLRGPFGTVVLDPPRILGARQGLGRALARLRRTVSLLLPRIASGGHMVLAACTQRISGDHLDALVADVSPAGSFRRVLALGPGPDHPVLPGHIEGDYLKVRVYQRRP
jgi:23S rRNA (cytosine1962-C5)-methyltransferase